MTPKTENPGEIFDELHALVKKAEKLISQNLKPEPDILSTVEEHLKDAQSHLLDFISNTKKNIVAGAQCSNKAIQANPYQSLAIATSAGVIIGILAARYSCSQK